MRPHSPSSSSSSTAVTGHQSAPRANATSAGSMKRRVTSIGLWPRIGLWAFFAIFPLMLSPANAQTKAYFCGKYNSYIEVDFGKRVVRMVSGTISDGAADSNYSDFLVWHLEINPSFVRFYTTGGEITLPSPPWPPGRVIHNETYYIGLVSHEYRHFVSTPGGSSISDDLGSCRPTKVDPENLLSASMRMSTHSK